MDALGTLIRCGDIQREIFYASFLHHNRVGEMICINDDPSGDTIIFERWRINSVDFVACFRLLSEDSLITHGMAVTYTPHEVFLEEKSASQLILYNQFMEKIKSDGKDLEELKRKAVEQGRDPELFNFVPFDREKLEEKLPAGKKTIIGDRNTGIEVMERQKEIPNDLQRPRLNRYWLEPSEEIKELLLMSGEEETLTGLMVLWREEHLVEAPRNLALNTKLPFLKKVVVIKPTIYDFPEKELNV